jgi:tripartite-type tricarboxylate transporter receptor subunit TctC
MRTEIGQPVVMDYRPGAGTIIGSEIVAKSAPDGYTLLATAGQIAINPSVYPKLPFDTVKDFVSVSLLATGPYILLVHPSVPAKNVRELVALAKARPGRMNYASASTGSGFHMAAEMFNLMTGTKIAHVPYKGGGPQTTALLSGEVDMMFSSPAPVLAYVASGRMRALSVAAPRRFAQLPNVPTMTEAGLPGFEAESWYGVFAPTGTPREIVAKLAEHIDRVAKMPEVRETLMKVGLEPGGGKPEDFHQRFLKDLKKWAKVAKDAGVKVE